MNEPKPFASLGPSLLARKGGARPAMRPQLGIFASLGGQPAEVADHLEDLGWNDMGHDPAPAPVQEAEVVRLDTRQAPGLTPAPANPETAEAARADDADARQALTLAEPAVKQHLRAIAAHLEKQDRAERAPARRPAVEQGRRAAFTLRLDARRHLRLRLACTMENRSAQLLLVDALDRYLAEIPAIEDLAAQVKRG